MDGFIGFLVLLGLGYALLPLFAFIRAGSAKRMASALEDRLRVVEAELHLLKKRPQTEAPPSPIPSAPARAEPPLISPPPAPLPPPLLPQPVAPPPKPQPERVPAPAAEAGPSFNWEQFMGAKLFAWLGGLALFLGVAFFVKYSFEHNLVPPAVRVVLGYLAGIGLVMGGWWMNRPKVAVTAQTLCATGTVICYAMTYVCQSLYHFAWATPTASVLVMSLITLAAFLLAVRMRALVVALLGMLGGYLTPVLFSTGQDQVGALFSYLGLLNAGLLAVALARRWPFLATLGAICSTLAIVGWTAAFFARGGYANGALTLIPMAILLGFTLLHSAYLWIARRRGQLDLWGASAALIASGLGIAFAFYFETFVGIATRPVLLFAFAFLCSASLLPMAWFVEKFAAAPVWGAFAIFTLLGLWSGYYLTAENLPLALGIYFIYGAIHAVLPLGLQRWIPGYRIPLMAYLAPVAALLLALIPVLKLASVSLAIWPFALLVDLLALGLAAMSGMLLPILLVLVVTLVLLGASLGRISSDLAGLNTMFSLLGGFSVLFFAAGFWLRRRLASRLDSLSSPWNEKLAHLLPALSAGLPYALILMAGARLPMANPTPLFLLALVLALMLLAASRLLAFDALPLVALVATFAVEAAWRSDHFTPDRGSQALLWFLGFNGLFAALPFIFARFYARRKWPWTASALSFPLHFLLVYSVVRATWPEFTPGLVPALFALPALAGAWWLQRRRAYENPAENTPLAWFAGVALLFLTLIFPIQFQREWLTLGWALEGAALCWLFRRLPHPGLRLTGVALLLISFARLALNPAVLSYHARSETPLFNWYLATYGVAIAAFVLAAMALQRPRNRLAGLDLPPWLFGGALALLFLLVNIEIANYFTPVGQAVLTLDFSANFGRDMSYSIAWALFAFALLVFGLWKRIAPVRYAGIALFSVTLLKLFFHDLANIGQLYRVGALMGVAVIAIAVATLYQRLLEVKKTPAEHDRRQ